jgi:hypothetical protein
MLRAAIPPWPRFGTVADDELMVQLADHIRRGSWLGDWSKYTLAKPAGYPIFLVMAHGVGLPPATLCQVGYLIGAVLVSLGLWWITDHKLFARIMFVVLAFNPAMFGANASRAYREAFLSALVLLSTGLSVVMFAGLRSWLTSARGRVLVCVLCTLAGFVLGIIAITKVDVTFYALSAVATLAAAGVIEAVRDQRMQIRWRALVLASLLAAGAAGAVVGGIALLNYRAYGVGVVDDLSSGSFAAAWKVWAGVRAGEHRPFVAISHPMREAVYQISPTARLLEPYLESPNVWKTASCEQTGICDEASSWSIWELRDAAMTTGVIHSACDFQTFFDTVRQDISRACGAGTIDCGRPAAAVGLPSPAFHSGREAVDQFFAAAASLVRLDSAGTDRPARQPLAFQMALWAANVRGVVPAAQLPAMTPQQVWFGSTVAFIRSVYGGCVWILLALSIASWLRWNPDDPWRRLRIPIAACSLAAVTHLAVLAFLDSAIGNLVKAGAALYLLPATPSLLVALVGGAFIFCAGSRPGTSRRATQSIEGPAAAMPASRPVAQAHAKL